MPDTRQNDDALFDCFFALVLEEVEKRQEELERKAEAKAKEVSIEE